MAGLRTEFAFTLPKGYVAPDGALHRDGVMRLATARDEIEPLRDPSIDGPDDPYLTILVLSRVITRLGTLEAIGIGVVENLFAADLAFLQDLYGIINFGDHRDVAALQASVLPDEYDDVDDADEPEPTAVSSAADGDEFAMVELPDADELAATPPPAVRSNRRSRIEEIHPASSA